MRGSTQQYRYRSEPRYTNKMKAGSSKQVRGTPGRSTERVSTARSSMNCRARLDCLTLQQADKCLRISSLSLYIYKNMPSYKLKICLVLEVDTRHVNTRLKTLAFVSL
ncbi:hypothetical protein WUBG_12358 [Wuchereria bancrofti]|uniref:Uncharacterized protein n=1 Tax=Wuchereria bancrofti TaxID=6293 RepID=J9E3K8_WUCBA|nr:hypothetical protein WUBG_12358 [Wuchereria bancrofti]